MTDTTSINQSEIQRHEFNRMEKGPHFLRNPPSKFITLISSSSVSQTYFNCPSPTPSLNMIILSGRLSSFTFLKAWRHSEINYPASYFPEISEVYYRSPYQSCLYKVTQTILHGCCGKILLSNILTSLYWWMQPSLPHLRPSSFHSDKHRIRLPL